MIDEGDPRFVSLLAELEQIGQADWALLYRHRTTGELWDVTYPRGEMQGGGPRRLRRLNHDNPADWVPYPQVS
jgi:hypothetical protein